MANALAPGAGQGGNAAAGGGSPPPPDPNPPTNDDRLARSEAAREALERHNAWLQSQLTRTGPPPANAPPPPDPFAKLTSEILTGAPDDQLQRLDQGTRRRVREEVGPVLQNLRNEFFQALDGVRTETSFSTVFALNPDIATDREGFTAAMSRAAFRAQSAGIKPNSAMLVEEAVKIYRESKPAPAPVLEGAGRMDPPSVPQKPQGPSLYEKFYGKAEDDELHEEDWDPKAATEQYADDRNSFLEEYGGVGMNLHGSTMARENAERRARKAAKKAAGA